VGDSFWWRVDAAGIPKSVVFLSMPIKITGRLLTTQADNLPER